MKQSINQLNSSVTKTTSGSTKWKNFSFNGTALSFKYPTCVCWDNTDCHKEAVKYLRDNKFPEVNSWNIKKGEIGEVIVADFGNNNSKIHATYSAELSTLVAFMNNTDMACLIDCGLIENNIYHGIKLEGVEVYQE